MIGHCQLCAEEVSVRGGLVVLHDVYMPWEHHREICPGSQRLPYEVGREDISRVIRKYLQRAESTLLRLEINRLQDRYARWPGIRLRDLKDEPD